MSERDRENFTEQSFAMSKLNSWLVYEIFPIYSTMAVAQKKCLFFTQLVCWNRREQFLINCRRTIFYFNFTHWTQWLSRFFYLYICWALTSKKKSQSENWSIGQGTSLYVSFVKVWRAIKKLQAYIEVVMLVFYYLKKLKKSFYKFMNSSIMQILLLIWIFFLPI